MRAKQGVCIVTHLRLVALWHSLPSARAVKRVHHGGQPVIDITGPGQTRPALGIYELDGDTLRICWATEETAARPRAFLTTATGGGKLVVLKRAKPVGK